jgi:RNA polymerase sigma-70 factor (ECF subfamily)
VAARVTAPDRAVTGSGHLRDGVTVTVYAFDIADGRITHIWAIRNPEKLRPWT